MTVYKVVSAKQVSVKKTDYGEMQDVALTLVNGDGITEAKWFTKASTPLPQDGDELHGTVEDGPYGKKFKKERPVGGVGGPRPRDPKESAAIVRQASQRTAAMILQAKATAGLLKPEDVTAQGLQRIVDILEQGVKQAQEAA